MKSEFNADLWSQTVEVTDRALESGALHPVATHLSVCEQQGVRFQLRSLAAQPPKPASADSSNTNPFLPYDPRLFVADAGVRHLLLLNKFPVVERHLLLVTRVFEAQSAPLELDDFVAASRLLAAADGLLFFNGGEMAGASQPHRHLQLIPTPCSDIPGGFPLATRLLEGDLPWVSRNRRFDRAADPELRGADWFSFYGDALADLGLMDHQHGTRPYNLLITSEAMFVIPRRADRIEGFSVNALGYAGLMLVKNSADAQRLRALGMFELLRRSGVACQTPAS